VNNVIPTPLKSTYHSSFWPFWTCWPLWRTSHKPLPLSDFPWKIWENSVMAFCPF